MDNIAAGEINFNQANLQRQIPIDLFVSKKDRGLVGDRGGTIRFIDSSANLVFNVLPQSHHNRLLVDSSANPLISIRRDQNGCWQGFTGDDSREENFLFRVERTVHTLSRTECEVFLVNGDLEGMKSDFKMKGCPFQRSCTIYSGNSIVAQTSLMYKLGMQKVFVPRNRFRLTIFPGVVDHALVVALIVIFFDGRKFWI
ncbi:hypothetical protein LguiA_011908 [Lonicera macranthoides]